MNKNPYINALLAALYIALLVFGVSTFVDQPDKQASLLAPIAMLSLLTLSAAVMGYLFVGTPLMLYIDGHKKEAVRFFLKTVGGFALLTIIFLVLLSSQISGQKFL